MASKKSTKRPGEISIGALMGKAHLAFNVALTERIREAGYDDVRLAFAAVFRGIDRSGTRVSVLAERAGVTKQTMSSLVREMVDSGYLLMADDPDDGRAKLAILSERGFDLAETIIKASRALERKLMKSVGERKLRSLRATLKEVLSVLGPLYQTDWYTPPRD